MLLVSEGLYSEPGYTRAAILNPGGCQKHWGAKPGFEI